MDQLISSAIATNAKKQLDYIENIRTTDNKNELSVEVTGWNPSIGKWEGDRPKGDLVRFDSTSSVGLTIGQVVTVSRPNYSQIGFSSHQ